MKITNTTEKLHKERKYIAGLLTGLVLFGGVETNQFVNNRITKSHTAKELVQFSHKDFSKHYLEEGIKDANVTNIVISNNETNPFRIAEDMRAKDVGVVAQEIYSQLDGTINPGDVVVIPKIS